MYQEHVANVLGTSVKPGVLKQKFQGNFYTENQILQMPDKNGCM